MPPEASWLYGRVNRSHCIVRHQAHEAHPPFGICLNMCRTRHIYYSESIDAIHICGLGAWRHDAVGSKDEASVECLELVDLLPPSIAIVAGKMRIFLEERVVLSGKHFRVGVDIHSRSGCLFEEFLKVSEVMAGDENTRILPAGCSRSLWLSPDIGNKTYEVCFPFYFF